MEQLNNFIAQARAQGQTDEQIRQTLIGAGWNAEQVNNVLGGPGVAPPAPPSPTFAPSDTPSNNPSPKRSKNIFLLVSITGVIAVTIIIGYLLFFSGKSTYQETASKFITAVQKNDQATADSLLSPAAKQFFQENAGSSSFLTACKQLGEFCTASFSKDYINNAKTTTKDYTAKNKAKGKQIEYASQQAIQNNPGEGCNSESTSKLVIAFIPKGKSWMVDKVDLSFDSSATLCPAT